MNVPVRATALVLALSFVLPTAAVLLPQASALSSSSKVALVGGEASSNGGGLYHSDPAFSSLTFTDVSPGSLTTSFLASFDTLVLNVASSQMGCSTSTLSSTAKAAIVSFAQSGGKVVIHDSECMSTDYSWVDFPFTTNNPGAAGAAGAVQVVEENSLSCSDPSSACFIDVSRLGSETDAIGDSNVVVTQNSHWCGDMKATNVNGVVGYNHMYALDGPGLWIYNGMDVDTLPSDLGTVSGAMYLGRVWLLELLQGWNPTALPCSVLVICEGVPPLITLSIDRPALGFDYLNDVPVAENPQRPVPRVIGPLTVEASTSDDSLVARMDFYVDGTVRASSVSPPWTFTWDSSLEPVPQGAHAITARAIEDTPSSCPVTLGRIVLVPDFSQEARALGVYVGNALPQSNDLSTGGALTTSASGHSNRTVVDQKLPAALQGLVRVSNDTVDTFDVGTAREAQAVSIVSHVELLSGAIWADNLVSRAVASIDRATLATSTTGASSIANLRINGQPVNADAPPNTRVDVTPTTYVVLNEQIVDTANAHAEIVVNALHVYVETGATRDEIVLGQSRAGVDLLRGSFTIALHAIDAQNDAALGRDAANDFAHADPAPFAAADGSGNGESLVTGRLGGADLVDYYSVVVATGQKLQANLLPADRVAEDVRRVHVEPEDAEVAIDDNLAAISMSILAPGTADARTHSAVTGLGAPHHQELNVDITGAWVIAIYHVSGEVANYTLSTTVSPLCSSRTTASSGRTPRPLALARRSRRRRSSRASCARRTPRTSTRSRP